MSAMKEEQSHEYFLRKAIALAQSNAGSVTGGPFGALVVKDGEIISAESNKVTVANDPTAHAEVNAIRAACAKLGTFELRGCILYSSCEPCPMCLSAAYWAHVDAIYFAAGRKDAAHAGFDDDLIYRELTLPLERRQLDIKQIIPEEGLVPFEVWMKNTDKVTY